MWVPHHNNAHGSHPPHSSSISQRMSSLSSTHVGQTTYAPHTPVQPPLGLWPPAWGPPPPQEVRSSYDTTLADALPCLPSQPTASASVLDVNRHHQHHCQLGLFTVLETYYMPMATADLSGAESGAVVQCPGTAPNNILNSPPPDIAARGKTTIIKHNNKELFSHLITTY
jgi:hypothetical protein